MIEEIIEDASTALKADTDHTFLEGDRGDLNESSENKTLFPMVMLDNAIRGTTTLNKQSTYSTDYITTVLFLSKSDDNNVDEQGRSKRDIVKAMEQLMFDFIAKMVEDPRLNKTDSLITIQHDRVYNLFDLNLHGVMMTITSRAKEHFTPCPTKDNFLGVIVTDANNPNSPVKIPAGKTYTCASAARAYDPEADNGSRTIYVNGDSAFQVANVFNNLPAGIINRRDPADNTKVLEDNDFGNKELITDENGAQVYTNEYYVHHIKGLGYHLPASLFSQAQTFFTGMNNILGTDFGGNNTYMGFTDWLPATQKQLKAIFNEDNLLNKLLYPPINIGGGRIWTPDTTIVNFFAYVVEIDSGQTVFGNKFTDSYPIVAVRKHFN